MPVLRRPDDHHRDVRKAYALRNRHRQAGSGSTPHDHRCASRLATRFLLPSSRAPEQEADVLTRSPVLLRPPCPRQARAYSRPNTPAVVGPAAKIARHQPPRRQTQAVRDPKISIGRARPNGVLPTQVSSLGGFRTPAPDPHDHAAKGRRPKPFHLGVHLLDRIDGERSERSTIKLYRDLLRSRI